MQIDQTNLARAVAKAVAYKQCGKDAEAERWAIQVVRELACVGILTREAREHDWNAR